MKTDICIRGAGAVGQVLALLLARARIRVNLCAAQPLLQSQSTDIRSYALNAASRSILQDLRAWPESACPVQHMQVFGDTRGQIQFDAAEQTIAWIVDAAELNERLQAAIQYAPDITCMPDSEMPPAALTVICEGRVSQTRQAVGATFEQFSYAQHAIAARLTCEKPHQYIARQWMRPSQVCALLPRGESTAGNSVALVWSVASERARQLNALSPQEFAVELSHATQGVLGEIRLSGERATWPLMLSQTQQWAGQASWGSWVLAGDAAHTVHPLAGQGLNLGLGDAAALAKLLVNKPYFRGYADASLLRAYARARSSEAALIRLVTDGMQRVFSSENTQMQGLRNWGMQGFNSIAPLKGWVMQQASGLR